MKRLENLNYYEVLEVSPNASQSEIRNAYEQARKTYSRDSLAIYSLLDERELETMSRLIEEAYQTIGNEKGRREYDRTLGLAEKRETKTMEPSYYKHLSHSGTPVHSGKTKPVDPDQREKIERMISQPEFEYTGPALRNIREALGLDLGEISMQTKVSRTNLQFIEEESYSHLPALVYVKGFVSEYAKCLGLDVLRVLQDYVNRYRAWERGREK
jgi:curved DNA-binding protein CbpA